MRQKAEQSDLPSYLHAFILAHDASQLQITFNLLSDLLEAVNDGHCGDGVDTTQNVQSHIHQTLGIKQCDVVSQTELACL